MSRRQVTRESVAFVFAVGIAAAILILALGASIAEAARNRSISDAAATLLSTVLGAGVGAIATYLGTRSFHDQPPPPVDGPGPSEDGPGPKEQLEDTSDWPTAS